MEQTFEGILSSLLDCYEKSESKDINVLLSKKTEDLGLTEESMTLIKEASKYIDNFAEKTASLEDARDEGISMKRWMASDLEMSMKELADNEKAEIMEAIPVAMNKVINQTTEEG